MHASEGTAEGREARVEGQNGADPNVINLPMVAGLAARVQLRRIHAPQSAEEQQRIAQTMQQLGQAAAADEHVVLYPSHVFVKGDQIVGYASVAAMPVINFWADSHKLHAAESLKMIELAEAVSSHQGIRSVVAPVAANSPFSAHMERLGYRKLGTTVLWTKDL